MSGHNLTKCAITHVLTESFENLRLSSYNTEYLLCCIKHDSHIFTFGIALNFLSDSSALSLSIQTSSSQYSFSSLYAYFFRGPVVPCLLFRSLRRSSVVPRRTPRKSHSSSVFAKRGTKTKYIDLQLHSSCPI